MANIGFGRLITGIANTRHLSRGWRKWHLGIGLLKEYTLPSIS